MSDFDSEENFFLALNAISEGAHDRAINHLKDIKFGDYYSRAQYLLGAEYAEIGMYDRAKQFFQAAISEKSVGELAVLQKGLLHVFLGENEDAQFCLRTLVESADEQKSLYWFAKGITLSLEAKNLQAIDSLTKGIELNQTNEPLNQDMRKLIKSMESLHQTQPDISELSESKFKEINNSFLLTNYKDDAL